MLSLWVQSLWRWCRTNCWCILSILCDASRREVWYSYVHTCCLSFVQHQGKSHECAATCCLSFVSIQGMLQEGVDACIFCYSLQDTCVTRLSWCTLSCQHADSRRVLGTEYFVTCFSLLQLPRSPTTALMLTVFPLLCFQKSIVNRIFCTMLFFLFAAPRSHTTALMLTVSPLPCFQESSVTQVWSFVTYFHVVASEQFCHRGMFMCSRMLSFFLRLEESSFVP